MAPTRPRLNARVLLTATGPDWAASVGAIAGAVSAMVVVVGGAAASRYLIRGTTSVEATASAVGTTVVLHVRPTIASQGATAIRLVHATDNAPVIQVVEYGRNGPADEAASRAVFDDDQVVGPGETITGSAIFIVDRPGRDVLGWQVTFTVGAPRWFRRQWFWVATTFVPAPTVRPLTRA
jgi:hypothetical protein